MHSTSTVQRHLKYISGSLMDCIAILVNQVASRTELQLVQQRFCFPQVYCIKAFGEPAVDGHQLLTHLSLLTLPLPEAA